MVEQFHDTDNVARESLVLEEEDLCYKHENVD